MVNSNLLKGTIIARGQSIDKIAKTTKMSRDTLSKKIYNRAKFDIEEMAVIKSALCLTPDETIAIFFN